MLRAVCEFIQTEFQPGLSLQKPSSSQGQAEVANEDDDEAKEEVLENDPMHVQTLSRFQKKMAQTEVQLSQADCEMTKEVAKDEYELPLEFAPEVANQMVNAKKRRLSRSYARRVIQRDFVARDPIPECEGLNPGWPLNSWKVKWLNDNWFYAKNVEEGFPIIRRKHSVFHKDVRTLRPGKWVCGDVIDVYFSLLLDREARRGWNPDIGPCFIFPCCFVRVFLPYRKEHIEAIGKDMMTRLKFEAELKSVLIPFGESSDQFNIAIANFLYFPMNDSKEFSPGTHWWLFVLDVLNWAILVYDSFNEDMPELHYSDIYKEQLYVVENFVPMLLRESGRTDIPDVDVPPKVLPVKERPKQHNYSDCGVFVCKYLDLLTKGIDVGKQRWTYQDCVNFRYTIAWELKEQRVE